MDFRFLSQPGGPVLDRSFEACGFEGRGWTIQARPVRPGQQHIKANCSVHGVTHYMNGLDYQAAGNTDLGLLVPTVAM